MATARKKGRGYEIRVSCGIDINGKKLGKSKTWVPDKSMTPRQIEKELERQKVLFEEEVKSGICPDNKIRFVDFSKRWMDEYAKDKLAIKTFTRYEIYLRRINKGIGHLKLKDITPLQLNAFYRSLEAYGVNQKKKYDKDGNLINGGRLAPKTILDHHRVISKILSTAVKWGLLEKNVAERADPPKVPHREIRYLNEEEVRQMITMLDNEPIQYRTMITLLVYTGIRRGELCGLEWKDIDFQNQVMHVCRSAQYIGNKTMITKESKTKSGIRHFSLSTTACIMLRKYRQWQIEQRFKAGDQWCECDRLFTSWNGQPIHPDTITNWFAKFIKRSELPYVTLNSLRHTNATLMIAEGTDVCTVSRRLGHANTATTLNIYAHALKSKDREAANTIERTLSRYA